MSARGTLSSNSAVHVMKEVEALNRDGQCLCVKSSIGYAGMFLVSAGWIASGHSSGGND